MRICLKEIEELKKSWLRSCTVRDLSLPTTLSNAISSHTDDLDISRLHKQLQVESLLLLFVEAEGHPCLLR